jgi:hypothetical protein|nr:MAG TPA: Heat shock factor binding protein 1 [Caudoviricetes sp.]
MTRKELEDMKAFASILKSRLEDAVDTREDIYDKLKYLEDTPIQDLLHEIGRLQDLDTELDDNLEDLSTAIDELEKALNKIGVTE